MKRGDLVTIALQGDQGKPQPALVIQSDFFAAPPLRHGAAGDQRVALGTAVPRGHRTRRCNGLRKPSQVMLDKAVTVARDKIGASIGVIDAPILQDIERRLAVFLGIAK